MFPGSKHVLGRIGIVFVVFTAIVANAGESVMNVAAYSCTGNQHCYNQKHFSGLTPGARSDILPSSSFYGGGDNSGTYNEIWLVDDQSTGCHANVAGQCWVEAGFQVQPPVCNNVPEMTWSDIIPDGSQIYMHNYCSGYYSDSWTTVTVDQRPNYTDRWDIRFDNGQHNIHLQDPDGSYNNAMQPDRIDIGEELFGTYGAGNGQMTWANNSYGGANQTFYKQTVDGVGQAANPPSGGWVDGQHPSQVPGGLFYSTCC